MANLDWSKCDAVESIPGKVSGAWVFKGTRMPVQTVFDVKAEEIEAVVRFVTKSLEKEPAFA